MDIFYIVFLLKFVIIYSRRISRIPEPWLERLMSCGGRTVTWSPSMRYLIHQMTRKLKMFLLFPPVLPPILFPVLLPMLSLGDQPLQGVHSHLGLALQGGSGTTDLMEKKLRPARVPVLMNR